MFSDSGEFRGESGRRRHTSGSRPISSAGEYPNFYAMLGLPKPEEGQVNLPDNDELNR